MYELAIQTEHETIKISKKTKSELEKFGKFGDTYGTIIQSLLEHASSCDRFWEDRF